MFRSVPPLPLPPRELIKIDGVWSRFPAALGTVKVIDRYEDDGMTVFLVEPLLPIYARAA